jgi:hypothetical protein
MGKVIEETGNIKPDLRCQLQQDLGLVRLPGLGSRSFPDAPKELVCELLILNLCGLIGDVLRIR